MEQVLPRREGTTVLLVEDDDVMRRLTRRMLEDHGYSVIEAVDGRSALHKLGAEKLHVDLVLTDVVMRGMSGPDLVLHLMETHPEVKVVYMSGYTGELLSHDHGIAEGLSLLEKPFTRNSLLQSLHAALG